MSRGKAVRMRQAGVSAGFVGSWNAEQRRKPHQRNDPETRELHMRRSR